MISDNGGGLPPNCPPGAESPYSPFPPELRELPQWVGHRDKVPINPRTGIGASHSNPEDWGPFREAVQSVDAFHLSGISFVFALAGGIVGIDLDDCVDPVTGEIARWARVILELTKSYAEFSLSGTGIHVYLRAALPGDGKGRKKPFKGGTVEVYGRNRAFVVTGTPVPGYTELTDGQDGLDTVIALVWPDDGSRAPARDRGGKDGRSARDRTLIEKATAAANGRTFANLLSGVWEGKWPGHETPFPSQSEADIHFCCTLAFWTGGDAAWVEHLFGLSGLVRDKWTKREDYRNDTIAKALAAVTEHYPWNLIEGLRAATAEEMPDAIRAVNQAPASIRQLAKLKIDDELEYLAIRSVIDERVKPKSLLADLEKAVKAAEKILLAEGRAKQREGADSGGYLVIDGKTHFRKANGATVELANFHSTIVQVDVRDDGQTETTYYTIESRQETGRPLPTVHVLQLDFFRPNWFACLGPKAIPAPGSEQLLRAAIQHLSPDPPRRRVYTHLGWREIEGRWVFLHCCGAIGAEGEVGALTPGGVGPHAGDNDQDHTGVPGNAQDQDHPEDPVADDAEDQVEAEDQDAVESQAKHKDQDQDHDQDRDQDAAEHEDGAPGADEDGSETTRRSESKRRTKRKPTSKSTGTTKSKSKSMTNTDSTIKTKGKSKAQLEKTTKENGDE